MVSIKKHRFWILLSVILLLVLMIISFLTVKFIVPKIQYIKITNLIENHKYNETIDKMNSIEFTNDMESLQAVCYYNIAKKEFDAKNYKEALSAFNNIKNLSLLNDSQEEASTILGHCNLNYAIECYNYGNFKESLKYFNKIKNKPDFINDYIKKAQLMNSFQGKWMNDKGGGFYVEVMGWMLIEEFPNISISVNAEDLKKWTFGDSMIIYEDENRTLYLKRRSEYLEYTTSYHMPSYDSNDTYTYICKHVDSFPEAKKDPKIGMTRDEVRNSTWGEPKDINKNTYSWGTTEQWCYYGNSYIYFENGIVTSISE